MKRKSLFLLLMTSFFLLGLMNSCYYDQLEPEKIIIIDPGTTISFADDVMPIFNEGCNTTGCHDEGGTAPDLSASNAYDALTAGGFIDKGDPENSELYQWMVGNRSLNMPLEGPEAEWNAIVLEWIKQGALDN